MVMDTQFLYIDIYLRWVYGIKGAGAGAGAAKPIGMATMSHLIFHKLQFQTEIGVIPILEGMQTRTRSHTVYDKRIAK